MCPSLTELGFKAVAFVDWLGWYGPAGTPAAKVASLNAAVGAALDTPAMADMLGKMGLEVMKMAPEPFAAAVKENHAFWQRVVKTTGFTSED